jgi:hypothetical protein
MQPLTNGFVVVEVVECSGVHCRFLKLFHRTRLDDCDVTSSVAGVVEIRVQNEKERDGTN